MIKNFDFRSFTLDVNEKFELIYKEKNVNIGFVLNDVEQLKKNSLVYSYVSNMGKVGFDMVMNKLFNRYREWLALYKFCDSIKREAGLFG
jgi:hypothetical protein